jgi:hypothetical protein
MVHFVSTSFHARQDPSALRGTYEGETAEIFRAALKLLVAEVKKGASRLDASLAVLLTRA